MLVHIKQKPPHQKMIDEHLPEFKEHRTCAFGSILFNPDNVELTPELMAHEMEHAKQQQTFGHGRYKIWKHSKYRVEEWWNRYLQDPSFRLAMELPASQREWWEFQKYHTDRNRLAVKKHEIAKRLASKLYGKGIKVTEALKVLDKTNLVKFTV